MKRFPFLLAVVLFVMWLLLNNSLAPGHIVLGALLAFFIARSSHGMRPLPQKSPMATEKRSRAVAERRKPAAVIRVLITSRSQNVLRWVRESSPDASSILTRNKPQEVTALTRANTIGYEPAGSIEKNGPKSPTVKRS